MKISDGIFLILFLFLLPFQGNCQGLTQMVRGTIIDAVSRQPLQNVHIVCETSNPLKGCFTDSLGRFRLMVPVGRHKFNITHVIYEQKTMGDVQVGSGKEVILNVGMDERVVVTEEVAVKGSENRWLNPMATVSARTLRSQDAERYAGGYFDPLRMVTNFAGVSSGKSDDNNEIVIRGNSPRGLLWRMEGIEIPNPNHFTDGQGASGGGFSSITTNVLSSFDFFTGSFPAEYGNAYSGVMDLNLRTGNFENREYSMGISVLGLEASAEGPINKKKTISFLANYRLADFRILAKYGIINTATLEIIPRSSDFAFKTSIKTSKVGNFDLFAIGGTSVAGDVASATKDEIIAGGDTDEFTEHHKQAVLGLKHSVLLPNNKTFLRTTAGYTFEFNSDEDKKVDTLLQKTITYTDNFTYPAFRIAHLINHKFNALHSFRAGLNFNYLQGELFAKRLNKTVYDTLIDNRSSGWHSGYFLQWKYKSGILETNSGIHFLHSGINREFVVEPRFGFILKLAPGKTINFGAGFHSKLEPLSIYNYRVKVTGTTRETRNSELKTIKAFHLTFGHNFQINPNLGLNIEAYHQTLYDIPVSPNPKSQYSIINSSYGLPDLIMVNEGKAKNRGLEITLEKTFSKNYYFMVNTSFFSSKYLAPDGNWYNTYYNTNFVGNFLGGKEFILKGRSRNSLGLKFRGMSRGGYRFTPVDVAQTLKNNRIVYDITETYGERLPAFRRFDFGANFRINRKKSSWIIMADIQNLFNRENIERRRFEYKNKQVITKDYKTLGRIPIFTIKTDF